MFKKIKKRDGEIVEFDSAKITTAIFKAGNATREFKEWKAKRLTNDVLLLADKLNIDSIPCVEDIQDLIERVLLDSKFNKTAKAYIIYREQRANIRDITTKANVDLVDNYIQKLDWKIKENSNMCYSLQGLNNYISSDITSEYWLNKIYPEEIRDAHNKGDIHIHDLGLLANYCCGWSLQDLLKKGFRGVSGKIASDPPRHFRSALGQIVNFFYTLQGEAAGAQAFSNFDTLLAPFVHYDNLDYREVKQAIQEFVFNMNVPTRVGGQTPFTNITMDMHAPLTLKDQPVFLGEVEQWNIYSDFQAEMDMINEAFAEVMMSGDADGRVFTFPIPTYNITKDFDWDNPNLKKIWKMTGKYGIPYFSNFINSNMSPDQVTSMCCRLRLNHNELDIRGGGLFGSSPLTGSIGVVTINIPRIGYRNRSVKGYIKKLTQIYDLAVKSLVIKRKILEQFTEKNLYPYSKYYLADTKQRTGKYWKNHFSTIGIIGMNEACLNLFREDIGSKKGQKFARKIMDVLRSLLKSTQKETGDIFNLEATPAEGISYSLPLKDKKKYPRIICANENDYRNGAAPYYSNSTQLPVNYTDDIFEMLDLQDELQTKYTGGTVSHLFLGEQVTDTEVVKNLIKKIFTNYKLPYLSLTPTFSICPSHGYIPGRQENCPNCAQETEVYSRVVGYLRPEKQYNNGKRAEFKDRKMYSI